ncbi:MAG: M28 family peptidase [Acidobacteriaceae bacterium]|nr:M28 family peptidase [Acidobacteriaceae bacterium]
MLSDLAAAINGEHLMAHNHEFARRLKLSGTSEELASFRYLEKTMAAFGYGTTLMFHDAYISLPGPARVTVGDRDIRCITHSMSRATPREGVSGEIIDVGRGDLATFACRDVRGKIVLVDGIASEEVAARASAGGAVGQIHVSSNEHLYEMCVSPVWGSPSQHTTDLLPTTVLCTIPRSEGEALRLRLGRGERVPVVLVAEVDTGWRKTPLLSAELMPERSTTAPFVLFSGHHDCWHYGVMDNGTANATMLEAARLLAERRTTWRRGLRVCFWSGHSHGRYSGSAWYADTHFDELDRRCAAHVNIDSTGGKGAALLTNSGVTDELKALAADEIRAVSGQQHLGRRHGRVADHSFWGVGVPSMFGSLSHHPEGEVERPPGALGWWWHTPEDLLDNIDPENHKRDTRIVVRVLARLLTDQVLPLDYATYADALACELDHISIALGGRFDIAELSAATAELKQNAAAVRARAAAASNAEACSIDAVLMRVSRFLVPLNYTFGDRFRHDPAVTHPPWPALEGLREMARLDEGSPDLPFYHVHARQTRNRVAHTLREANRVLAAIAKGGNL